MKAKSFFYYKVFLIALVALLIIFSDSRSFGYEWQKTFGGAGSDAGRSVQQTTDGGFIIAGYTESFGAGGRDVYLIKTDALGNEIWSKTFGGSGEERGCSVQQTTDGGFIIVGVTGNLPHYDVYLIKTDALGNEIWSKTFGNGNIFGHNFRCSTGQQTTDGGFIILAEKREGYGAYLIKTDTDGNEVWTKFYENADHPGSVQETTDGGYILTGMTSPLPSSAFLLKTDVDGNELWFKTYKPWGGFEIYNGRSVQQTTDGGYIFTGVAANGHNRIILLKTDGDGNEIWNKIWDGNTDPFTGFFSGGNSVQQTTDGGYIVAGRTTFSGAGKGDAHLIKTDTDGNEVWTKTFGGSDEEWGFSVQQTTDGGFIFAGETESFGAGDTDVYLIYYNPTPTCEGKQPTIIGTEGRDIIVGTEGSDVIHGLGGNDVIQGLGGDDVICGGTGMDVIGAGSGNDIVLGENGHDVIWGGHGNDILRGGDGNDSIYGGPSNDILGGGYGNDSLYGKSGVDKIWGGSGPNNGTIDNNDTCYDTAGTFTKGCEVFYEQ